MEVTVNGYGERCGNADLCVVVPNLQLKMGRRLVPEERLRELTSLSRFAAEMANMPHDPYKPYVGRSAFANKGASTWTPSGKPPEATSTLTPGWWGTAPGSWRRSFRARPTWR